MASLELDETLTYLSVINDMNLYRVALWVRKAWKDIEPSTIAGYWKKAGFPALPQSSAARANDGAPKERLEEDGIDIEEVDQVRAQNTKR